MLNRAKEAARDASNLAEMARKGWDSGPVRPVRAVTVSCARKKGNQGLKKNIGEPVLLICMAPHNGSGK